MITRGRLILGPTMASLITLKRWRGVVAKGKPRRKLWPRISDGQGENCGQGDLMAKEKIVAKEI
jgi:hypothetical protein